MLECTEVAMIPKFRARKEVIEESPANGFAVSHGDATPIDRAFLNRWSWPRPDGFGPGAAVPPADGNVPTGECSSSPEVQIARFHSPWNTVMDWCIRIRVEKGVDTLRFGSKDLSRNLPRHV